jgi:hypothetical protein
MMEAIAMWDFISNTEDLLSFSKGDVIQASETFLFLFDHRNFDLNYINELS